MLELITSRKNEGVRQAAKLLSCAASRREQRQFLAEGARLCRDAALSGISIETAYVTERARETYGVYVEDILDHAAQSYLVEPHVADLLSDTKHGQGVFCVCRIPEPQSLLPEIGSAGKYLALENIQDPANLGTVLRTAEALGIHGVILGGSCCDEYSPKSLRASMGAIFRLPVYACEDLTSTIQDWNTQGFCTLAAVPAADAVLVTEVDFSGSVILVVGNEGNGLEKSTIAACRQRVTIPMLGRAESLNAAASASILMWEMMRSESR